MSSRSWPRRTAQLSGLVLVRESLTTAMVFVMSGRMQEISKNQVSTGQPRRTEPVAAVHPLLVEGVVVFVLFELYLSSFGLARCQ